MGGWNGSIAFGWGESFSLCLWRAFAVVDGKWRLSNSSFSTVVNLSRIKLESCATLRSNCSGYNAFCGCASADCDWWVLRCKQAVQFKAPLINGWRTYIDEEKKRKRRVAEWRKSLNSHWVQWIKSIDGCSEEGC